MVATPVYKGSYSGALKHLFDLVRPNALTGKPVLVAATGGSPLNGLVTEHQLRPLFGFFNALTLPTAIFALESDFQNYRIDKPELWRASNGPPPSSSSCWRRNPAAADKPHPPPPELHAPREKP